jgi:integrase/recombinase XerD
MDPVVDRFLDSLWLEDGLARNTLAAYRRDLEGLGRWLASRETTLVNASEADLTGYFASQHAATRAATANRRLAVLRRFYRWALRERLIAADPTLRLHAARRAPRCSRCFTPPGCACRNWSG